MKPKTRIRSRVLTLAAHLLLAFAPAALATPPTPLNGAQPRPFYLFAHNPNTLEDVEDALKKGFNALEPDITEITCNGQEVLVDFDSDAGSPTCAAELKFFDWCKGVNALAQKYPQLALVAFDTKDWAGDPAWSSEAQVQKNAVDIINAARFLLNSNGVNLNVIYSVPSFSHSRIMEYILQVPLGPREGVQIDDEDRVDDVLKWFFQTHNYSGNIGYGDGTSTIYYPLPRAMDRAAYLRASVGYPKAVTYVYALTEEASMHSYINAGVDGIIPVDADQGDLTNVVPMHPEIRLATRNDNPFQPLNEAYAIEVHTGNDGTDADIQFTLTGCRGSAIITVNGGNVFNFPIIYPTGRFEAGNPDWITIPSKDLGELQSITIKNLGGGIGTKWEPVDFHVSSARYIGPNWFVNGKFIRQYSATFNGSLDTGDSATLTLTPNFTLPLPTIQCPADVFVVNAQNQCGAIVNFAPTVSGPCDDVTAVCDPPSGSFFHVGATAVTCHAEGGSGQSAPCTFTVTVIDTQPPTIQCPAPITVSNDSNQCGAVVTFSPLVSGPCNDVTAVCSPPSGSLFPLGQTPVVCYAQSASGPKSLPCFFTVTVKDTQPPTITCPAPMSVKATSPAGAVVSFAPSVSDNCSVATVTCTPGSGIVYPIGDTMVNCTAKDPANNQSSCSFKIHVKGAAEQTADLITLVNGMKITSGSVKKALLANLNAALACLKKIDLLCACGSLQSFIDLVNAQRNKSISSSDANALIAAATQIRVVIGCMP